MVLGGLIAGWAVTPSAAAPPADDYAFVAWCNGMLGGYLDLREQVMPDVTRIETTFRAPGSDLAEDLKGYADLAEAGRRSRADFDAALTAAESAGLADPGSRVAPARLGREVWPDLKTVGVRRVAQEWMSWTLPARCETAASAVLARAQSAVPARLVEASPASTSTGRNLAEHEAGCRDGRASSCRMLARERARRPR